MSAGITLRCDGTPADRPGMALERCRAWLPTPALAPDEARWRVAAEAGFGTPASLRQHLRAAIGVAPNAYRRTYRGATAGGG